MKLFQREDGDDRPVRWWEFLDPEWPPLYDAGGPEWALMSVTAMVMAFVFVGGLVIYLALALLK